MRKMLVYVILALSVASCSVLDAARLLDPNKPSIEANIGKNVEQEKNNIKLDTGNTTKQEAEVISNDTNQRAEQISNIVQGMSSFEIALMVILAGIAIPSAGQIWKALGIVISDVYRGILTPFRDLYRFLFKSKTEQLRK